MKHFLDHSIVVPPSPRKGDIVYEETQMQASKLSLLSYTKELEHVKGQLRCSEHREEDTFCWVEKSQPGAPHYPLCTRDLQEWAKYLVSSYSIACALLLMNFSSKLEIRTTLVLLCLTSPILMN
jgi:hypothetical protein